MIVREEPDGSLVMIGQSDHSKLSGVFAAHWGNEKFQRPRPYESAVRAAMLHDCGWFRYEANPRFDEATGKTPNFMQVALDKEQLDAFQWGTDWLTDIDSYAGLLINRHRTGLWRGRYGTMEHPVAFNPPSLPPTLESFINGNEARQEKEKQAVDAAEFETNYRLLQVWDFLSLFLCVREPKEDYIDPVPLGYGDAGSVRMTMRPLGGGQISLDPYPFDVASLPIGLVHRRLPTSTFPSKAAFQEAYYKAPPQVAQFEIVKTA
jgi:hypothetical protein